MDWISSAASSRLGWSFCAIGTEREVEAANSRFSRLSSNTQMLTERAWKRSEASLTEAWQSSCCVSRLAVPSVKRLQTVR